MNVRLIAKIFLTLAFVLSSAATAQETVENSFLVKCLGARAAKGFVFMYNYAAGTLAYVVEVPVAMANELTKQSENPIMNEDRRVVKPGAKMIENMAEYEQTAARLEAWGCQPQQLQKVQPTPAQRRELHQYPSRTVPLPR